MKARLVNLWEPVKTSFWFVPGLMVFFAIVAALVLVKVDQATKLAPFSVVGVFYITGPEGARSILSTIAGSMITVAGVAFSVIIVALTLASSQLGPRLLRNFMSDRSNQIVLGTFIATFVYCLIILGSVGITEGEVFVPSTSILFALILALFNVGMLIYFIHHVSASIQADHLTSVVYKDLKKHICRLFPDEAEKNELEKARKPCPNKLQQICPEKYTYDIAASNEGYLQATETHSLVEIAEDNNCIIRVHFRAGQFIASGIRIATVNCNKQLEDNTLKQVENTFMCGRQRTPEQDIEFAVLQLVEIAVRALSPGINDPFTAIACIDRLGSALCNMAGREFPSPCYYDKENELRLIMKPIDFDGVINAAFNQIRQYGRSSVAVTIRLLEACKVIAEHTQNDGQRRAVRRQADMILESSRQFPEENDRQDAEDRFKSLLDILDGKQAEQK